MLQNVLKDTNFCNPLLLVDHINVKIFVFKL